MSDLTLAFVMPLMVLPLAVLASIADTNHHRRNVRILAIIGCISLTTSLLVLAFSA